MALTHFWNQPGQTTRSIPLTITIEPMLFLYVAETYMKGVVAENLNIDRFCRISLDYPEEDCANINDGEHEDLQVEVEKLDSVFKFYENLAASVIPVLLLAFIASWSDKRGRQVPIMLSVPSVVYLLESLFPSWPPQVLLVASFLESLGGCWMLLRMASYNYIVDVSGIKSRTLRLILVNLSMNIEIPAGVLFDAWVYNIGGFVWVFSVSLCISIIALVFSAVTVRNKKLQGDSNKTPLKTEEFVAPKERDRFNKCSKVASSWVDPLPSFDASNVVVSLTTCICGLAGSSSGMKIGTASILLWNCCLLRLLF